MSKNVSDVISPREGAQGLIEVLKERQRTNGYLSSDFMAQTARALDLPLSAVYGVATFYSFLSTKPKGKYIVRVCKSLPCLLESSQSIVAYFDKELGIAPGETTKDGKFSLELTNCIGACDKAPAMMINDCVYGDLTPSKIATILKECT